MKKRNAYYRRDVMKKKTKILLGLGCASLMALGLGACAKATPIEDYQDEGYKITVRYDANGGSFMSRPGITIVDMFNPSDYQADGNGIVQIPLLEPTDSSRPTSGAEKIALTKPDHFFAGWYATRTVKTKDGSPEELGGVPVDENGKELVRVEKNENVSYVYADDTTKEAVPAYTYSDYWDFENDRIEYALADTQIKEMTLYAGWLPYYEFEYYYQEDGVWTEFATTNFDYKTTNAEGSKTHDKDTIWIPTWENGAMKHTHDYENTETYEFPKMEGFTFSKAFTDPECTNQITGEFIHQGGLELETCVAVNPIQKIYVQFEKGERYRIETAKQLKDNANLKGIYEILADLDFSGEDAGWPTSFPTGKFEGQMYSSAGNKFTLSNISAKFMAETTSGGMFGSIGENAVVKDLVFENVTTDIAYANGRLTDFTFGAFAGSIAETANVSNVAFSGTLKIGTIKLDRTYTINLLATGNVAGIQAKELHLQVYGKKLINDYSYTVNFADPAEAVKIDANLNVTLLFVTTYRTTQEIYNIQ